MNIIQKDKELLIFLNNLGNEYWDPFWLMVTDQRNWIPLFLLIIFLIFKQFGWKKGGLVLIAMIVLVAFSDQFTNLIKNSIQRIRPNNDIAIKYQLRTLISPQSFSFMSGHATTSTFFTVFVILLLKEAYKFIYFLILFPLIFAYSRLYLGIHFPIDILVGILIGTFFAFIYHYLFNKLDKRLFS